MNPYFSPISSLIQQAGTLQQQQQQAPFLNPGQFPSSQQNPLQFVDSANQVANIGGGLVGSNPNFANAMLPSFFGASAQLQSSNPLASQFGNQSAQQLLAQLALHNLVQSQALLAPLQQASAFGAQNHLQSLNQIAGVPQNGHLGTQNSVFNANHLEPFAQKPTNHQRNWNIGSNQVQGRIPTSGSSGVFLHRDSRQMNNRDQNVPILSKNACNDTGDKFLPPNQKVPSSSIGTQHNKWIQGGGGLKPDQVRHHNGFGNDISRFNSKHSASHNFGEDSRGIKGRETSKTRFQKPQYVKNTKEHHKQFRDNGGHHNMNKRKHQLVKGREPVQLENKRLPLNYSQKEIEEWREARKRNFPTKANTLKKSAQTGRVVEEADAKLRRQQLKEVLAQQAELGVEVAEVPLNYLQDPDSQICVKNNGRDHSGRINRGDLNGKCPKKFKQGRHNRYENSHKRRKLGSHEPAKAARPREPSLLKKLLSSEIKGDRSRLLQAFRFMVMNSFFDGYPGSPLRFPEIQVMGSGERVNAVDGGDHVDDGDTAVDAAPPRNDSSPDKNNVAEANEC